MARAYTIKFSTHQMFRWNILAAVVGVFTNNLKPRKDLRGFLSSYH